MLFTKQVSEKRMWVCTRNLLRLCWSQKTLRPHKMCFFDKTVFWSTKYVYGFILLLRHNRNGIRRKLFLFTSAPRIYFLLFSCLASWGETWETAQPVCQPVPLSSSSFWICWLLSARFDSLVEVWKIMKLCCSENTGGCIEAAELSWMRGRLHPFLAIRGSIQGPSLKPRLKDD